MATAPLGPEPPVSSSGLAPLCSPGRGLTCFACCPPIRPAGHDHLDHRSSWRRFLSDNRAEFLAGHRPEKEILGFFCPGLGFLDPAGKTAGCLYHPLRNSGQDLRVATGYQPKCARETCPELRAFARLEPASREALLDLCAGLDAFGFSSRRANPVMRLLGFGPTVAAAVAGLKLPDREALAGLAWLWEAPPAWGWLLGRLANQGGREVLLRPGLAAEIGEITARLARELGPAPPLAGGRRAPEDGDEWEARFWLALGEIKDDQARRKAARALVDHLLRDAGRLIFLGGADRSILD